MSSPPPQPSPAPGRFAVLRERDFALYWYGQLVSLVGSWMQQLALSWTLLELAPSAFILGVVNFVSAVPPALLMLTGGVVADRLDRRRILIATNLLFLCGALVLAVLVKTNTLSLVHVFVFAAVIGVGFAFELPANQALVPDLVRREQIPAAVQLNQAIFHGSRLVGPAVAGALIARYGTYSAFLANAFSFVPVIVTLLLIRPRSSGEPRAPRSPNAMREGLAYVRERPQLRALLGLTALVTVLVFPNMVVLMPFYVKDVLRLDARAMGLLMSAGGAGALVGSLSLLYVPAGRRIGRIGAGLAGMAAGLALLWASSSALDRGLLDARHALLLAVSGGLVLAFSVSSTMGLVATILQQTTPDALRGRVMSVHGLVFMGCLPFASLAMTKLVDAITMPLELLLASALVLVAGAPLHLRLRGAMEAEGRAGAAPGSGATRSP